MVIFGSVIGKEKLLIRLASHGYDQNEYCVQLDALWFTTMNDNDDNNNDRNFRIIMENDADVPML